MGVQEVLRGHAVRGSSINGDDQRLGDYWWLWAERGRWEAERPGRRLGRQEGACSPLSNSPQKDAASANMLVLEPTLPRGKSWPGSIQPKALTSVGTSTVGGAPSHVPQTWLGGGAAGRSKINHQECDSHQMLPMFSTDGGRCHLSKPANKGVALLLSKDGDQVATFQEQEGTIGKTCPLSVAPTARVLRMTDGEARNPTDYGSPFTDLQTMGPSSRAYDPHWRGSLP